MKTISPFIVVITAVQEDCAALRDILGHLERDVVGFRTLREAVGVLRRASIVLSDAELRDGGWRDVMRRSGNNSRSAITHRGCTPRRQPALGGGAERGRS